MNPCFFIFYDTVSNSFVDSLCHRQELGKSTYRACLILSLTDNIRCAHEVRYYLQEWVHRGGTLLVVADETGAPTSAAALAVCREWYGAPWTAATSSSVPAIAVDYAASSMVPAATADDGAVAGAVPGLSLPRGDAALTHMAATVHDQLPATITIPWASATCVAQGVVDEHALYGGAVACLPYGSKGGRVVYVGDPTWGDDTRAVVGVLLQ